MGAQEQQLAHRRPEHSADPRPRPAQSELRIRLCDARIPPDVKQTYLGMLSLIGADGPFTAMMDCGVAEVTINVFNGLDQLPPNYRKVPELFVSKASERGNMEELIHQGVAIWRQVGRDHRGPGRDHGRTECLPLRRP